jgi:hypothetical protein
MTTPQRPASSNPVAAAVAAANVRRDSERPQAPRQRPANFGGPRLKLSVIGEIPGYHLYWENDENGQIEQLMSEGFELVSSKEVSMQSHIVADADVADRVSRFVGSKADGSPLRAVLLKLPEELWAEREAWRLSEADSREQDIRDGLVQADASRYQPKGTSRSVRSNDPQS